MEVGLTNPRQLCLSKPLPSASRPVSGPHAAHTAWRTALGPPPAARRLSGTFGFLAPLGQLAAPGPRLYGPLPSRLGLLAKHLLQDRSLNYSRQALDL